MARKKQPKQLTGPELAQRNVKVRHADSAVVYSLPVNENFEDPNEVMLDGGVPYPSALENDFAEQGITRYILAAMFPEKIAPWIVATAARKRGLPGLAADLVALRPNPDQKPTKKLSAHDADVAAMLRALQRSAPAKKGERKEEHTTIRKPLYRQRIALLRLAEAQQIVLGVRGWWLIYEDDDEEPVPDFRVFHTIPRHKEHGEHFRRATIEALSNDGAGFIALVIEAANILVKPYGAELDRTHELRVEVSV